LLNLQNLRLPGNGNITDEGLESLSCLISLNLTDNVKITDYGIKQLLKLKNLDLFVDNNITNEGLKSLSSPVSLNLRH
jgi:hypothetical protein